VDVISRGSGPHREDEQAKRLIAANRPTIERLADQLSNGAYSARKAAKPRPPEASGLVIHTARAAAIVDPPKPFVRVAVNGRVSIVDANTGRQLHHLGDLRRRDRRERFVLATRENGFFSPVETGLAAALAELDGHVMEGAGSERALVASIGARLGLASNTAGKEG
jgi:hypothetical protein